MIMKNNGLFNFDGDDIKSYIQYDMRLMDKMNDSFNYIYDKLVERGHFLDISKIDDINLEDINWNEGKNYKWCSILSGDVALVIRQYGSHFTIYTRHTTQLELSGGVKYDNHKYSSILFNTSNVSDDMHDFYCDNPHHDLNDTIKDMISIISNRKVHTLWNPRSFKRPDHCSVKIVVDGERIHSIDKLIYCAEELSTTHLELFAEGEMLEKLKEYTDLVGEKFNYEYHIKDVVTEFPKEYSEPYYHGVGINFVKEDGTERFYDVYSLTRYYFDDIFNPQKNEQSTN